MIQALQAAEHDLRITMAAKARHIRSSLRSGHGRRLLTASPPRWVVRASLVPSPSCRWADHSPRDPHQRRVLLRRRCQPRCQGRQCSLPVSRRVAWRRRCRPSTIASSSLQEIAAAASRSMSGRCFGWRSMRLVPCLVRSDSGREHCSGSSQPPRCRSFQRLFLRWTFRPRPSSRLSSMRRLRRLKRHLRRRRLPGQARQRSAQSKRARQ